MKFVNEESGIPFIDYTNIELYKKFIKRVGKDYRDILTDEEIESQGLFSVVEAHKKFDPKLGFTFEQLFTEILRCRFIDSARTIRGRKFQKPMDNSVQLSPENIAGKVTYMTSPIEEASYNLPSFEKRIFGFLKEGYSCNEIATNENLELSKVYNLRKSIGAQVRKLAA